MADPHDASDAHDGYVRGTQEIGEQSKTFGVFMTLSKWGSLVIAALVLFLTLWFQPDGSFIFGAVAATVLVVAGWFMLRSKPSH
jgi:hypothetical protein